ncbi:MAG: FkbM family methyltransferase [Chitinophagaceae bacterium]|nr:FkbM family methyltransferase [Chitinophagaceae bacterium]
MAIKEYIKSLLVNLTPIFIKRAIIFPYEESRKKREDIDRYLNLSYSQEGEDLVLYRLIGHKTNGFYVDIGAHHPYRFSNTYKFYQLGWRGINIDPLPESMNLFKDKRPRDISLELAIVNSDNQQLHYYMFAEPALNTMDQRVAIERELTVPSDKIIKTISVPSYKLVDVLDKHLPSHQEIDFFSIDVEGMDFSVIQSNNWDKYRPKFVVLESLNSNLQEDLDTELTSFLMGKNYNLVAKTANALIYERF